MELWQECGFPVEQAKAIVTNNDAGTDCNKTGIRNEITWMMHEYTGIIHKNEWIIANLQGWLKKLRKI